MILKFSENSLLKCWLAFFDRLSFFSNMELPMKVILYSDLYIQCIFNFFPQVRIVLYTESMTLGNQHASLFTRKEILKYPFPLCQSWLAYYLKHYLVICLINNPLKRENSQWTSLSLYLPTKLLPCMSLINIWRCRRIALCRYRWSPYH